MDIDELTKKYAPPNNHQDTVSKKRRAADGHASAPAASTSSASAENKDQQRAGRGKDRKEGKEGTEKRSDKGKGTGKGKASTTEQVLSTHAKAILRLEQERRDRDRAIQWAVDFRLPYDLLHTMYNVVAVQRAANKDKAAEGGDKGPAEVNINDIQWRIFAGTLYADAKKIDQTSENHEALARILKFLNETVYHEGEVGPDRNKTACQLIKPAHRLKEDSALWTWIVRFRMDTARGRDIHEQLLTCHRDFAEHFSHVSIRKDRAPKDGLTRQIESQLEGLRI